VGIVSVGIGKTANCVVGELKMSLKCRKRIKKRRKGEKLERKGE
jgi:hypothetical protein